VHGLYSSGLVSSFPILLSGRSRGVDLAGHSISHGKISPTKAIAR
jgi:hypothetical protein